MAYLIEENEFAFFDLIDVSAGKVIASSTHPEDLHEFAVQHLSSNEVSCLVNHDHRVVETLPGGVKRTIEPLSVVGKIRVFIADTRKALKPEPGNRYNSKTGCYNCGDVDSHETLLTRLERILG